MDTDVRGNQANTQVEFEICGGLWSRVWTTFSAKYTFYVASVDVHVWANTSRTVWHACGAYVHTEVHSVLKERTLLERR